MSTEQSAGTWRDVEESMDEYLEGYEFRGDAGDYSPTDGERFLIKDAIMGLLAEDEFIDKLRAILASPPPQGAQEASVYLAHHKVHIDLRDVEAVDDRGDYPDECTLVMRGGARYSVSAGARKTNREAAEHWSERVQAAKSPPSQPVELSDEQIEAGYRSFDWSSVPHPFRGSVGFERGARWAMSVLAAAAKDQP